MVKSDKLYSVQSYVELVTGKCYIVTGDDDIDFIRSIISEDLWDYSLLETDHIVENNLNVVLVDCMVWNEEKNEFEHEYRWFEVPEDTKIN